MQDRTNHNEDLPGEEEKDPLEAGIKAAFELDPAEHPRVGDSVVGALEARIGLESRIRLKDPLDSSPHIAEERPVSQEQPKSQEQEKEGRYHLISELARGGLGIILKGRDKDLGRNVAMKSLLDRHSLDSEMTRRLVEEAQIGGQLQHPGIVPVYDIGLRADKRPFFTMKLVEGETLASLLDARDTAGEDQIRFLRIFEQVCQTIAYAHARGVIHRDLKPSNIMVGAFGEVQVMDWGLAKVIGQRENEASGDVPGERQPERPLATIRTKDDEHHSQAGSVMGTFAYMAPEQARGEVGRLDERCDVFGLGAILCEILTGKPPFWGKRSEEIRRAACDAVLDDCWRRLADCEAEPRLVDLAQKCLAPVAADRPQDAGEVARDIEGYLAAVAERARRSELEAAENKVRAEEAEARAVQERRARKLALALAATIVFALVIGGGGYSWFKSMQRERMQATTDKVNAALAQASLLLDEARATDQRDLDAWAKALEKGRYALDLMEPDAVNAETRDRVEAFLLEAESEQAQAKTDHDMVRRLEAIRIQVGKDWDWNAMNRAYTRVFKDYGIDTDRLEAADAARQIRESAISRDLVAGLDEWIHGRTYTDDKKTKLLQVAVLADPDPWRKELRRARHQRDRERILELARSASIEELSPADANALGRTLWLVDEAAGISFCTEAARHYSGDFWINFNIGWALTRFGSRRLNDAIRYCDRAVAIRPESASAWSNLARALTYDGRKEEAHGAFRRALNLDPDDPIIHGEYGFFLCHLAHEYDEAIKELVRAIALDPNEATHYLVLGYTWQLKGDLKEAWFAYEEALKLNPKMVEALGNQAVILMKEGDLEGALDLHNRALAIDPENGLSHHNRGRTLNELGDSEAGFAALTRAVECDSSLVDAWVDLGKAYRDRGEPDEAERCFREALRCDSQHADARQALEELNR